MKKKKPSDPIRHFQRKSTAARRLAGRSCACGETRPEALIAGSDPTICAACRRMELGQSTFDDHHPAGKANYPTTVPIWVNDHRAWLTPAQYDWPKKTWENPLGSPLLAAAASIRGHYETTTYLNEQLLLWVAPLLEALDETLSDRLEQDWWIGTPLEKFAPKRR